ncbi:Variant-specific surface protein [Giardia duodenalis]|uniref:Variant-specific surface protein n=1 Tax=Giardia intestinalis TaxID=5741 RepID=V6TJ22_GIAIN|nr:Variant-specific surface protein [Giardia intestinalis]
MFEKILFANCILQLAWAACLEDDGNPGTHDTTKCKKGHCDVSIGGQLYCSKCSVDNEHLVDGTCVASATDQADTKCIDPAEGKCGSCKDGYFMYKSGCYNSGGSPGNKICTSAPDGKCSTPAAGYFIIPTTDADASHQSVVSCSDSEGANGKSDKIYKGVEGCAECTLDNLVTTATCTKCTTDFLHASIEGGTACLTECPEGYFKHTATSGKQLKTCQSCSSPEESLTPAATGVPNCIKCTYDTKVVCEKCDQDKYLKTESGTTSCVDEGNCNNGFFPMTDAQNSNRKVCALCSEADKGGIADCETCSKTGDSVTCTACTEGNKPNADKTACIPCSVDGCDSCNEENVCAKCATDKYLTSTGQCVDDCEALEGYYSDKSTNKCEKCSPVCKMCTKTADQCSSCPAKKVL